MKAILPVEAMQVAKACGDDSFRPQISGVHLRPDGSVEGTNGHMLFRYVPDDQGDPADYPAKAVGVDELADIPAEGVVIPAETCLEAGKAAKRIKHPMPLLRNVVMAECNGTVRLASTNLEQRSDHVAKPPAERFPMTDNLWPKKAPVLTIGFNARYLKALAEAAIAMGNEREVRLELRDPLGAVVAYSRGERGLFQALLMPVKLSSASEPAAEGGAQ